MSTVLLPMKPVAELPPPPPAPPPAPAAGDDADGHGERVPLVAWLVGTLPPGVVGVGVLPELPVLSMLPAGTSFHSWLAPPLSLFWATRPPSALEPFWTSTAMPLKRLIRRT